MASVNVTKQQTPPVSLSHHVLWFIDLIGFNLAKDGLSLYLFFFNFSFFNLVCLLSVCSGVNTHSLYIHHQCKCASVSPINEFAPQSKQIQMLVSSKLQYNNYKILVIMILNLRYARPICLYWVLYWIHQVPVA